MGTELARPTVLTKKTQDLILKALAAGSYLQVAIQASGINHATFYYWKNLYDSGAENAQRFADFFEAVKTASAVAETNALHTVRQGEPGWQANAWFLERRFPKRWGRKDQVTTIQKDMSKLSDEELEAIASGKSPR